MRAEQTDVQGYININSLINIPLGLRFSKILVKGNMALLQEAKANRARLFATRRFDCDARSGAAPEEGETLPDPDQGPEADMDEPEDEEPTTAEMNEFFDAITAMG